MRGLWLIPAVLGVVAVYAVLDNESGLRSWWRWRQILHAEEAKVSDLKAEVTRLSREINALESEPFAVERAIREELEYARPGEIVVRLPRAAGD